jgi:hypothetical protein
VWSPPLAAEVSVEEGEKVEKEKGTLGASGTTTPDDASAEEAVAAPKLPNLGGSTWSRSAPGSESGPGGGAVVTGVRFPVADPRAAAADGACTGGSGSPDPSAASASDAEGADVRAKHEGAVLETAAEKDANEKELDAALGNPNVIPKDDGFDGTPALLALALATSEGFGTTIGGGFPSGSSFSVLT